MGIKIDKEITRAPLVSSTGIPKLGIVGVGGLDVSRKLDGRGFAHASQPCGVGP